MKNGRMGVVVVALLVLVAVALAVYGPLMVREKAPEIPPAQTKQQTAVVTAKGIVESEEEVEIGSPVSGTIREISGNEGDTVKKGQVLVLLDDDKVRADIRIAEASLREANEQLNRLKKGYRSEDIAAASSMAERAEAIHAEARDEYERLGRLYEKDAVTLVELNKAKEKNDITARELDEAKAQLEKLKSGERKEDIGRGEALVQKAMADLHYRKTFLKDYRKVSPFEGMVTERYRDPDETVDKGTPILKLINTEKLRITSELEETDVGKVVEGATVDVLVDAYPDKTYHGKVYRVLPIVKRKRQQMFDPAASFDINAQDIHIRLDDYTGLKSGMSVTVRFKR